MCVVRTYVIDMYGYMLIEYINNLIFTIIESVNSLSHAPPQLKLIGRAVFSSLLRTATEKMR